MSQKQIFEPPHRHLEGKEEEQRDMEQAFENMYMAATGWFFMFDRHLEMVVLFSVRSHSLIWLQGHSLATMCGMYWSTLLLRS